MRPVDAPHDSKVIVSACEAAPYNIQRGVKLHDRFWLKSQPYSLREMFTEKECDLAGRFVDGDIYQGFLSGFNYHRWHAPVSGTITHAYLVDGSYYSDLEAEGVDSGGLNDSQGYITSVAARAVVAIECDDAQFGTVACICVGMADVSSCVIDALPGQRVNKGDELGYFQYGGSTWCLVMQPGVVASFVPEGPFSHKEEAVRVNASLAVGR